MSFNTEEILAKYDLFWQYPVITEKEFYEQNKNDNNYLGIPWATLIDLNIHTNNILKILLPYIKHKNYYTCCQHVCFRKFMKLFSILGIKEVYTPHKIIGENELYNIVIKPCPLYAVNIEDINKNEEFKNIDFLNNNRKLLYSFMGAYQKYGLGKYISEIRENIYKLKYNKDNALIINTGGWHFNDVVYSNKQNSKNELNIDKNHIDNTIKYNKILLDSRYSLCPSGSGPNSIRFWESLAVGAIPVLLADTLDLVYNIDWDNTIVRIKEKDINNIENILNNISIERENELRNNCIKVYEKLRKNYKNK